MGLEGLAFRDFDGSQVYRVCNWICGYFETGFSRFYGAVQGFGLEERLLKMSQHFLPILTHKQVIRIPLWTFYFLLQGEIRVFIFQKMSADSSCVNPKTLAGQAVAQKKSEADLGSLRL